MEENEVILFQALVELRGQLTEDFTGDYSELKEKADGAISNLLDKQLSIKWNQKKK